ncbi:MAG: hypothetical protein Fur002_09920 [Anaerolineales bacterium]
MNQTKKSSRLQWWKFAKVGLALALIGVILSTTDINHLLSLHEKIIWNWLYIYALLYAALTALKSYQYKQLLNLPVPYPRMVSIVVLQNGISNIFANSAGIASYLVMMSGEEEVSPGRAALVFIIAKVGDLFAIWLMLMFSGIALWNQIPVLHNTVLALLISIGTPLFGFLLLIALRQRVTNFLRVALQKTRLLRFRIVERLVGMLETLVNDKHGSLFDMTRKALILSSLYFFVTNLWYVAQMRMFSIELSFTEITMVTAIMQLIAFIPITILGGLGVVELSSLYLYNLVGVDSLTLAAALIGLRALFYVINLLMLLYLPIYSFIENRSQP